MKFLPLMLMRARGLAGPFMSKHRGIRGLSKSVGNFIGINDSLRMEKGWTGAANCGTVGSPYTVHFSDPVYFTNYAGMNFYNVTQGIPATGISSSLDQAVSSIQFTLYWAFPVEYGDVVELRYAGGDYGDKPVGDPDRVLMENQVLRLVNCAMPIPPELSGTPFDPPDGTVGTPYSYDTSAMFTGVVDTYTVITGTLPDGLSLNSSTGIISGIPTTEESQAGISVTGANAGGSATTNTADIEITILTTITPNIVGETAVDGDAAIIAANLIVGTVTGNTDPIIAQDPIGGTVVNEGTAVNYTLTTAAGGDDWVDESADNWVDENTNNWTTE